MSKPTIRSRPTRRPPQSSSSIDDDDAEQLLISEFRGCVQRYLGRFNGDHDMSLALRLSHVELDGDDFAEVHGRIDELIGAGELELEGRLCT